MEHISVWCGPLKDPCPYSPPGLCGTAGPDTTPCEHAVGYARQMLGKRLKGGEPVVITSDETTYEVEATLPKNNKKIFWAVESGKIRTHKTRINKPLTGNKM